MTLIEQVARELCRWDVSESVNVRWGLLPDETRESYRREARKILRMVRESKEGERV